MDFAQYEQFYNEAMLGMDTFFQDRKDGLKNFDKTNYPAYFEHVMKKYDRVFRCIEEVYNHENDKDKWLNRLAERFADSAQKLGDSKKWKFQKDNTFIDCSMFAVSYVLPAVNEFKGNMSAPFAKALADCWNKKFGTQVQAGSYDTIYNGFSNSILGIKFGK